MSLGQKIVIGIISLYQKTLSPDHGWFRAFFPFGVCRFCPTCSQYTKKEVQKRGVWLGLWRGLKRVSKCHPFSKP